MHLTLPRGGGRCLSMAGEGGGGGRMCTVSGGCSSDPPPPSSRERHPSNYSIVSAQKKPSFYANFILLIATSYSLPTSD